MEARLTQADASAKYALLREELRRNIQTGKWPAGSRIPSESALCRQFGASRSTLRRAVDELVAQDLLVRQAGRGTFVKTHPLSQKLHKFYSFSEELKKQGQREHFELMHFGLETPESDVREALFLKEGESVFLVSRLRFIDSRPYAVEHSYIPEKAAPDLSGGMICSNGLYRSLTALGATPERATETFSAVNLTREDARRLDAKPRDAAIRLCRTAFSGETAVEYCKSLIRADIFFYTVELGGTKE